MTEREREKERVMSNHAFYEKKEEMIDLYKYLGVKLGLKKYHEARILKIDDCKPLEKWFYSLEAIEITELASELGFWFSFFLWCQDKYSKK